MELSSETLASKNFPSLFFNASQNCCSMPIMLTVFCASDCADAGFAGSWPKATAAAATRIIRIVSFRIGTPFPSTVSTHNLSLAETNEHDATYQEHDRRLQGASTRCLTRPLLPATPKPFWISPSREAPIVRC